MSEIKTSILAVLGKQSGPVTYSYIDAVLPKWDFSDISKAIDALKQLGAVSVGLEGVALESSAANIIEDIAGITDNSPDQQNTGLHTECDVNADHLPYDILVGDSEPTKTIKYEQIFEEESRELIASIEDGPSLLDYSDEKTIGFSASNATSHKAKKSSNLSTNPTLKSRPLLHAFDTTDSLAVSNRIRNALQKNGLYTVKELIANLEKFLGVKGLGEKSKEELLCFLDQSSNICKSTLSSEQVEALCCLSNSTQYIFDAFGALSVIYKEQIAETVSSESDGQNAEANLLALPIDVLELGDANTRCFKRNGITTIESLVSKSGNQLLKLRGVGALKVEAARVAVDKLLHDSVDGVTLPTNNLVEKTVNPLAYEGYLYKYDNRAVELLGSCAMRLCREGLDLLPEAFRVYYLPMAQEALDVSDGNIADAEELILKAIAESPSAIDAFKASLKGQLEQARAKELTNRAECTVRIPENPVWQSHVLGILQEFDDCVLDETSGNIRFKHPTLDGWIQSLPKGDAELLSLRLRGFTLDECGKRADITRERVRQVTTRLLNQRPLLEEDAFRYLYTTYDTGKSNFTLITGADVKTENYLNLTTGKGDRRFLPLAAALSDELISDDVKSSIRSLLNKDFIFVDGERVRKDRRSIILFLVNKLTEHSRITITDLQEAYARFLSERSLESKSLPFGTLRNLQEWMKRNVPEILGVRSGEDAYIRYYDASQYDFSKLKEFMTSGLFEDIECSSALIFNHPLASEIIEELEIKDEYELHYIARNYCDLPDNVVFGRMPTIIFGDGDRGKQILDLIQEYGPIDASTLASLYREKYGVPEATFKGSYLKGFEIYKSHGSYSCSFEEMSNEQLETLSTLLTDDFHPMSLIKLQFKDKYPDDSTSLINKLNLEKVGYRPSHELLIRSDLDERAVFENLIDSHASFGPETEGFIAEIFKHPDFDSVLQIRINSLDVVEYEKDRYIHLDAVISAIDEFATKADFENYVEKVLETTNKNEPFTVHSLRGSGFTHRVEGYAIEVGFGDEFLESLISTARVGGRIKTTSVGNRIIFCKTPYCFSVVDLFEKALGELKSIDVEDLCLYMKDKYGIEISPYLARNIIRRSELFYHKELDRVFESLEEYDKLVQEVLSRQ